MARARSSGNGRLEEGMAALQQSQAALQQSQAILTQSMAQLIQNHVAFEARANDFDRIHAEDMRRIDARFAQIEARLVKVESTLADYNRVLTEVLHQMRSLTEEVRGKIGFKPPQ